MISVFFMDVKLNNWMNTFHECPAVKGLKLNCLFYSIQEQKHTAPPALLTVAEQWKNIVTTIKDIKQKSMVSCCDK